MSELPIVAYIVARGNVFGVYGAQYLVLEGPFHYPRWSSELRNAQKLTKKQAFQWAGLEKGRVLGVLSDGRLYGCPYANAEYDAQIFDPRSYLQTPGVRVEELPHRRYVADEVEVKLDGHPWLRKSDD